MMRGVLGLGVLLLAMPAQAQNTAPLSPPGAGGSTQATPPPTRDPGVTTAPAVIPPRSPDPGMSITPPVAGATPVIPPPGSTGNSSTVIPK